MSSASYTGAPFTLSSYYQNPTVPILFLLTGLTASFLFKRPSSLYNRSLSTQDSPAMAPSGPPHNIVIVGGSFGGLPTAHTLLGSVIPTLKTGKPYKVYIISPNTELYWKIGAPRIIANPALLPVEKAFLSIADGFKKYNNSQFEHIQGYVSSVDPSSQTLSYGPAMGEPSSSLHYDTLVLATGTSFKNPMWSSQAGEGPTKAALEEVHRQITPAKKIMVIGGGAAGTETAGELAYSYGSKKEILLLTGSKQPLPRITDQRVGKDAQGRLQKMGVKVINDLRTESISKNSDGKTIIKLSNGSEEVVDLVIEATGDTPNNSYIPKDWLNERGVVKTVAPTLRLDVPGVKNVYSIGSVASYSNGGIPEILHSYKALGESIRIDLAGESKSSHALNN